MTSPAVVVGGGISGVACAGALAAAGVATQVVERGRRVSGRMSSRTLRGTGTPWDGRVVDVGASYFTVSDPDFALVVDGMVQRGIVRPWTTSFHVAGPDGVVGVTAGPMRFAAAGGLRSVVEALAEPLPAVVTGHVVGRVDVRDDEVRVDDSAVSAAALCMPDPQVARICADMPSSAITWEPVITVTCVFAERAWIDLDGVFVNDDPVLTWIADDGRRRGDAAPVLVAHVHPVLSARHLDDPPAITARAVAAVQRVLSISAYPEWVDCHRWTFAKPLVGRREDFWLHPRTALGVAGDSWAGGPRVESAWLSGHRLGVAMAQRLNAAGGA